MNLSKSLSLALVTLSFSGHVFAKEGSANTLKIGAKIFKLSDLLKRSDIEQIIVKNDPAYPGREMRYQAIKAKNLFTGIDIKDDDVIQFRCADGYAAPISKERMLVDDKNHSIAYVAIEDPANKWPKLPDHADSAGPFYLVWLKTELSGIVNAEWPFKVVAFEVKGTLRDLYPNIFPVRRMSKNESRGFQLFQKNCFACHTINKQGASQVGPDLNTPMSPTEYFKESALKKYIRDPKSLRSWSESKMPAFGKNVLSDEDIENIVSYLKVMAR